MKVRIDRKSGLSLHQQLKSVIEHGIYFGHLTAGTGLPSVRDMAAQAEVAPMTVAKVYAELKASGLIETRTGSGSVVAQTTLAGRPDRSRLAAAIDSVTDMALSMGAEPANIPGLITARVTARPPGQRPWVLERCPSIERPRND